MDLWVFLLLLAGTGCPPSPASVGAPCDLGVSTSDNDVTISSPALECGGGLCLQVGTLPALCSAECASDDDCEGHPPPSATTCHTTFTCMAATSFGRYACRKLCICQDLLPAPPLCQLNF
jgi:hypothetical protein